MRVRSVFAATAVTASLALTLPAAVAVAAPVDAQATPTCRASAVKVKAAKTSQRNVFRVTVQNTGSRTCAVDRFATVTFGALDGAAEPVPSAGSGSYKLAAGAKAHAKVRTVKRLSNPDARTVNSVRVAADAGHRGTAFSAAAVGAPGGVKVYEPVTTWWHKTQAQADRALRQAG
ncbi:DUF4232 domain-containing protein [Streptomyces sp. JNUCC 64]